MQVRLSNPPISECPLNGGKQAWDEVSSDTIIKCFKRTGLYPEAEVEEDEDDPFEGEELSSLQLLVILSMLLVQSKNLFVVMTASKFAPVW